MCLHCASVYSLFFIISTGYEVSEDMKLYFVPFVSGNVQSNVGNVVNLYCSFGCAVNFMVTFLHNIFMRARYWIFLKIRLMFNTCRDRTGGLIIHPYSYRWSILTLLKNIHCFSRLMFKIYDNHTGCELYFIIHTEVLCCSYQKYLLSQYVFMYV